MKKYLNFSSFFLVGFILAAILIFVSESFGFSHLNFIPLGGESWALWAYPTAFFFGLLISSFLFGIKDKFKILSISLIIIFLLFLFIFSGSLFVNSVPFGK
ncbi:MAG: hypothetical protein PHE24_03395 [Patescibacteria group bacterium]|nr:hypothetical protein [Patescibacteria group bacterium]